MDAKLIRFNRLSSVFTPGTPVAKRDLFAGRITQVFEITGALTQPGRHVVLYGERGAGKTSLANVLSEFLAPILGVQRPTIRINCSTQDNYKSIWSRVLRQLKQPVPETWTYGTPNPDEVRLLLEELPVPAIVILDEFDRLDDDDALSLMSDTIKALSDHATQTKVVIVGVADSIDQLIGEHESVQRAIEEVLMPRMTREEQDAIVRGGLDSVGMRIGPMAAARIVRLAEGLPHYVHLLALYAAQRAVTEDREDVTAEDIEWAITKAVERHSLLKDYQTAIQSPRRDNLFERVLISCAVAEKNRLGYFKASDVRDPMTKITGKPYDIPAFSGHLKAFTEFDRGSVLQRTGPERRYTYRFRNPLLQPFTVLSAIASGLLTEDHQRELLGIDLRDLPLS